jgi:hypothetical protein
LSEIGRRVPRQPTQTPETMLTRAELDELLAERAVAQASRTVAATRAKADHLVGQATVPSGTQTLPMPLTYEERSLRLLQVQVALAVPATITALVAIWKLVT